MIFSQDFVGFRLTMLINETNQQGTACSFDLMAVFITYVPKKRHLHAITVRKITNSMCPSSGLPFSSPDYTEHTAKIRTKITRISAAAERPRDASRHRIFR